MLWVLGAARSWDREEITPWRSSETPGGSDKEEGVAAKRETRGCDGRGLEKTSLCHCCSFSVTE